MVFIDNFISINDGVISKEDCDFLISTYESESRTRIMPPQSSGRVCETITYSTDRESDWKVNRILLKSFSPYFDKYAEKYKDALCLGDKWLFDAGYNLQKYVDGDGYFDLHSEQGLRYPMRMLAWMVYLNDAKCGTEFPYQKKKVKAKTGRLVIWPAGWTHLHKGETPNKGLKYILTGWCEYTS